MAQEKRQANAELGLGPQNPVSGQRSRRQGQPGSKGQLKTELFL